MDLSSFLIKPVRLLILSSLGISIILGGETAFAERGQLQNLLTPPAQLRSTSLVLELKKPINRSFDLSSRSGLQDLEKAVEPLLDLYEAEQENIQAERNALRARVPLEKMSQAQLRAYYWESPDVLTKRDHRGISDLGRLAREALEAKSAERRDSSIRQIFEVAFAMNNNRRAPVPRTIEALQVPYSFFDYAHNPVCVGEFKATDLARPISRDSDLGLVEPLPSSFWSPVNSISSQDLYYGFGRKKLPKFQDVIWKYEEPKTSFGCCGGFEASGGKQHIKVKFCETTSEPFTARIFGALGYNVEPTDYVPWLRVAYNRRLFMEYHLRKDVKTTVAFFGVLPVYRVNMQDRYDPFEAFACAMMKDGTRLTGKGLKKILFHKPRMAHPEDLPGNFKEDVEAKIDFLITRPANVQLNEESQHSIGPWDFNQLAHEDRRELRGSGVLAAWLGWFDCRYENTRLKSIKEDDRHVIKHFYTDLGGGLGRATGIFSRTAEMPNQFTWTFTQAPRDQGPGRMTIPFRVVHYQPNENTDAFAAMTVDDARWMARKIAQLSEAQITAGLVGSGFDSAQVKLYTEKLIARRDNMIRDLGLGKEIALLRPNGPRQNLNYTPAVEGVVKVTLQNGKEVAARPGPLKIQNGVVTPWPPPMEDLSPRGVPAQEASAEEPTRDSKTASVLP